MSLPNLHYLIIFFTTVGILFDPVSCTEFVYNANFSSSNLLMEGIAAVESSIVSLTNDTTFSMGRAFYPSKIPTELPNSSTPLPFFTSFIFSIVRYKHLLPGHGFVFGFFPVPDVAAAAPAQHLGLFNFTNNGNANNHIFGVEFDVFTNQEFDDISDNHVGVDVNSLTSIASHAAGVWGGRDDDQFEEMKLNNGVNYQVWIDYEGSVINVSMAKVGDERPRRPLISESVNLFDVLLEEMYVGFTAATGQLAESHKILAWGFSNSNSSIGDALVTTNLPSFMMPNNSVFQSIGFIAGVCFGALFVTALGVLAYLVIVRKRGQKKENIEDWELEYWPHRIEYQEIYAATKGFSQGSVIGCGGNGKVYRGVLSGGVEVAVKRISLESGHGMREFLAEVSSLGRLKHRNLVGLRGWCRETNGSLILVYDYMTNGSVDKRIFECDESSLLSWEERIKILKDVASGILYLHEGWEAKVLHRDIKASNVLLDKDMNARLGDFGLARVHHHGQVASTTQVVGTVGYMAPEVVKTGRASTQTDVFGFGVLILELVCGRRPTEEGKPGLVEYVHRLMERGELLYALDNHLKAKGDYNNEEVERVLHLGLLCVHPEPNVRPTMRQAIKILENMNGDTEFEGERQEVYLLDRKRTTAMWKNLGNGGPRGHPTFDEIQKTLSSSFSLTNSDVILEGR
ncbi:hypothetical protein SLEP1_g9684 [Rubroshorea leprosula]|uniref:non-specific serine/threonine protein kinase n=1 Tax=Rubroshorea leprosula TaxID=152421 RepID=A0AAV5IE57_9ROSI|nr:hypothetical protein SLEP1_g9684 [Rubroshorea leprosula]